MGCNSDICTGTWGDDMPGNLTVIPIHRDNSSLPSDFHCFSHILMRDRIVVVLEIDMAVGFDQPQNGVEENEWFLRRDTQCLFLLSGKYISRNQFGCAMNSSVGDGVHPYRKLSFTILFIG